MKKKKRDCYEPLCQQIGQPRIKGQIPRNILFQDWIGRDRISE